MRVVVIDEAFFVLRTNTTSYLVKISASKG